MVETLIPREPDTRPETTTDRWLVRLAVGLYVVGVVGWLVLVFNMPRVFGP